MAQNPYNYDTFRRHMMQEDMHFRGGPEPGQLAPDFDLPKEDFRSGARVPGAAGL
jgi:hypothetical protein